MELDRRDGNTELNCEAATATFKVSRTDEVQMICLRQLGKNSSNFDQLVVSGIEIFGTLQEPE
jgi:hypothetical protein